MRDISNTKHYIVEYFFSANILRTINNSEENRKDSCVKLIAWLFELSSPEDKIYNITTSWHNVNFVNRPTK